MVDAMEVDGGEVSSYKLNRWLNGGVIRLVRSRQKVGKFVGEYDERRKLIRGV